MQIEKQFAVVAVQHAQVGYYSFRDLSCIVSRVYATQIYWDILEKVLPGSIRLTKCAKRYVTISAQKLSTSV